MLYVYSTKPTFHPIKVHWSAFTIHRIFIVFPHPSLRNIIKFLERSFKSFIDHTTFPYEKYLLFSTY